MKQLLEQMREFKEFCKENISKEDKIIDVIYYGEINLSKNDGDISNEKSESIYLVKKEQDGKTKLEFYANFGIIAEIGENGEIKIATNCKDIINEKEFLLQLQKVMPISLEKLEQRARKNMEKSKKEQNGQTKEAEKENKIGESKIGENEKKYKQNAKDIKIDMNTKIAGQKTFSELVPEIKEKGIQEVIVRRKEAQEFEFIGIDEYGNEVELETLERTEGTNPNKEIIKVSRRRK